MISSPVPEGSPEGDPFPYAIYLDGVPYSERDSVIGVWFIDLLTGKRYLMILLRKFTSCRCGCRGWCSFFQIFLMVNWCNEALHEGRYPLTDHLNNEFEVGSHRWKLRGKKMRRRGVCLYIKGDWSEYANTLGLSGWGDLLRPCFECVGCGDDLYVPYGSTPLELRCLETEEADNFDACARCEILVALTAHSKMLILASGFIYIKGSGRCLRRDVDELRLKCGDRLEPSNASRDVF